MDILSDIINSTGLKGSLLAKSSYSKEWGLRIACDKSFGFHIVTQGSCYVKYKNMIKKLETGDMMYVSRGVPHEIVSSPKQKGMDLDKFIAYLETRKEEAMNATTTMICASYLAEDALHPFFYEIPDVIQVNISDLPAHHPLHSALMLASQELDSGKKADIILERLADIMMYYILKHWVEKNPSEVSGWIKVFREEKVLSVLESIHNKLNHPWTLDSLAASVGVSRATLANRFRDSLGLTPMDYLARLRIEKGKKLLKENDFSLEEVARKVGYSSSFAFSKAYKRFHGLSPSHDRI